jgi:hypothetical protein
MNQKRRARSRRVINKPKPLPPPVREDENDREDPDDQACKVLIAALEEGPGQLAELRRRHSLQPTQIGRLLQSHPDLFATYEQAGKPFIKLRVSAVDAMLDLVKHGKGAHPLPVGASSALVGDNAAVSGSKSVSAKPETLLMSAKNRLVEVLSQSPRYSPFLEDIGFTLELIREINLTFPNLIVIEANMLGQMHAFRVRLAGSEAGEITAPEPTVAQSAPPPVPDLGMSDEDRARLSWRPASPGSANRRAHVQNSGIGRQRNPLVNL